MAPPYAILAELVAVQLVTAESTSDTLEEVRRNMAPPYASTTELEAVQWETVESTSDALEEEERSIAAPLLTPPPFVRCKPTRCKCPPFATRRTRERCWASRTAPGGWLVSVTLTPSTSNSLPSNGYTTLAGRTNDAAPPAGTAAMPLRSSKTERTIAVPGASGGAGGACGRGGLRGTGGVSGGGGQSGGPCGDGEIGGGGAGGAGGTGGVGGSRGGEGGGGTKVGKTARAPQSAQSEP